MSARTVFLPLFAALLLTGCGSGSDDLGVAAECTSNEDCPSHGDIVLECLTQFRGGYCGLTGCNSNEDCPEDALCVEHTDSNRYCFRACIDKRECNANRTIDNEANCSSNIVRTDGGGEKACVPPSSG